MTDHGGLQITGLRKRFGDIQALDGVDLQVAPGQLIGFLGPNGAGKSTTMRSVLGLTSIDEGSINWEGRPITTDDRREIGYMPQDRGLYPRMRVHEHIAYMGRLAGLDREVADRRAHEWSERVGLDAREDDLIQELSTGNQQRVQLAVALVHEPKLIVMDEPFAGLDPVAVAMLSDVMHDQVDGGASVVFSSHQLDLVQDLAEEVTIIANGRTQASGRVMDLREQSPHRLLTILWGDDVAPEWTPPGADVLDSPRGVSRFKLTSDADAASLISGASQAGVVSGVRFEPPGLEDVFLETVDDTVVTPVNTDPAVSA